MKRKKEKVPGFDEIIFENRNKEYGAYELRRKYLPATFWSVIGGTAFFTVLVLSLAFSAPTDVIGNDEGPIIVIVNFDSSIKDLHNYKQEIPDQPKPEIKPTAYVAPEIKDSLDEGDETMRANVTIDTTINKPVVVDIIPANDPDPIVNPDDNPDIFVSEPPIFPGGDEAMMKFIYENIKYPEDAIANNIEGKVTLRFVVSVDGSVKRVEILKGADPLLNQEAIRVISQLPKWKPGKNNGNPAAVWFTVPVTFKLKDR